MSRSGYIDDYDDIAGLNLYRGAVERSIRGRRGQSFLRDLADQLDALPVKRLVANSFEQGPEVCTLGSVTRARGIAMDDIPTADEYGFSEAPGIAAARLNIAPALAAEIMYENDECAPLDETPEQRWQRMRDWVSSKLIIK